MAIEQGNRVRRGALCVHVVNVECAKAVDVDVPCEHGERVVERLLVRAPVVPGLPSFHESLEVGQRDAVFPVCVLELVGEGGEFEFFAEAFEFTVGHGYCE